MLFKETLFVLFYGYGDALGCLVCSTINWGGDSGVSICKIGGNTELNGAEPRFLKIYYSGDEKNALDSVVWRMFSWGGGFAVFICKIEDNKEPSVMLIGGKGWVMIGVLCGRARVSVVNMQKKTIESRAGLYPFFLVDRDAGSRA
ncbi:hypothetical protein GWI33_006935 [Rhynchophorus ferrugineus]|uniref:Uncharacterized protein n=1 Tax=Rhynchophorus ferrugineus TaxID=354439 RepID=A0A834ID83_RHYFE|nr:hypothetical protein GWI33_006935 [Rhynchophorus ferrugineus]